MGRVENGRTTEDAGPRHPSWLARVRAKTRESRGAAAIEAAIVTPVFFILIMGIVEIGLAMNDYLALSSAVRAGSRTASASGDDLHADYNTVQRILRESTALDERDIQAIVIYKAPGFGEGPFTDPTDPDLSCTIRSVDDVCNYYTAADWNRPKEQWGCQESTGGGASPDISWCPTDRKVSLSGAGSDYVGVWMKVEHRWVTKMFGNVVTLTDQSVIRLEPRSVT